MVIKSHIGCVNIRIDTKRMDGNLREAQKALNEKIKGDCEPYIPFNQGALRGSARFPEGVYGGEISYESPYAHYQYMGDLYLTEDGRSFAHRHEMKYKTDKKLKYHTPGTGAEWFETAKATHGDEWIKVVKDRVGR